MTQNGTLGVSEIAIAASSVWDNNPSYQPYNVFDKSTTTNEWITSGASPYLILYTATPIRIKTIQLIDVAQVTYYPVALTVKGSNTNGDYSTLAYNAPTDVSYAGFTTEVNSNNYYTYHRFELVPYTTFQCRIAELVIEAYYKTDALNSLTFPMSYSNTNYAVTISQLTSSISANSIINNKSISGCSLSTNINSGDILMYNAIGY